MKEQELERLLADELVAKKVDKTVASKVARMADSWEYQKVALMVELKVER